jgi:hypothetical protein
VLPEEKESSLQGEKEDKATWFSAFKQSARGAAHRPFKNYGGEGAAQITGITACNKME